MKHLLKTLFCVGVFVTTLFAIEIHAGEPTGDSSILPSGAKLEQLWNEGEFTEGVAVAPDGVIYFSDIAFTPTDPGRILKFDPKTGKTTVHCADSKKSNGLMFDRKGRLIAACGANHGAMALCEITPAGKVKVLVDKFNGRRFNSPNDLVIHPDGTFFFSDPRYVGPEPIQLDLMSVYRYNPADKSLTRMTTHKEIQKPNGVHVSPNGKILYVAETNNGTTDVTKKDPNTKLGRMTLNSFRIKKDGTLGKKKVLIDFGDETGTDGMTIDKKGNIYAAVRKASRHGIVVFTPKGKELAYIPTEELPTNCCFGNGDDAKTLYVTAGGGLFRIKLNVAGFHPAVAKR
jgi:gluconolactonase